jgi:molybdopterin synthase catalytic subunit
MLIKIYTETIRCDDALQAVRHPVCGAIASFTGIVRDHHHGRTVLALEYHVYEKFFFAETRRILDEMHLRWPVKDAAVLQRVGRLQVGDTGVFIAVSSPHRAEGLAALAYVIEQFKHRAPVWKREHYATGTEWVVCHHGQDPAV